MDQRLKLVFGAMCVLLCGLCLSKEASGQSLPDGKGKTEFIHNCTACHRADMVTRVKKTPEEWRKSVDDMAARGTDGTKEDLDNVVLYLNTNYGTDKSASAAATPPAAPASTPSGPAALSSAEIAHAKRVINENGCLACHRVEKQGGYSGPSLNGVGARRSADEIRSALVSPHRTVGPGNSLVILTTADGKKLSGRLLSQDDGSVRVMDALGVIATYPKPGLRQLTVVDTNPMPSYDGRMSDEDLNGLVRYLGSLPAGDDGVQK